MKNIHFRELIWYNEFVQEKNRREQHNREGVKMELKQEHGEGVDSWKEVTLIYNAALRQIETKMEILNDEFQHVHQYNPIEYIKSRIKSPESIVKKLKKNGYETSIQNMVDHVNDIAGIRIVCSFTSDIYRMAEMIGKII